MSLFRVYWAGVLLLVTRSSVKGECHFELFEGQTIFGLNHETYSPSTVAECQRHCLQQQNPPCLSFDYIEMTSSCFISTRNRQTAPEFFGPHPLSDYYELVGDCTSPVASANVTASPGEQTDRAHECKRSRLGQDYRGLVSQTASGRECQRWDSQSPHSHGIQANRLPEGSFSANENYCRNPDGEPGGPWCYTVDPVVRWEYCSVPVCAGPDEGCNEPVLCIGDLTNQCDNAQCQAFPNATCLEVSCVTCHMQHFVDNKQVSCDPPPPPTDCKRRTVGADYMGNISKTASGRVCQRWESQVPHSHQNQARNFPEGSLIDAGNKCRNPSETAGGPWCYTEDRHVRWEFCNIPVCNDTGEQGGCDAADICPHDPCEGQTCFPFPTARCARDECEYCGSRWWIGYPWAKEVKCSQPPPPFTTDCLLSTYGKEYMGTQQHTHSGKVCQRWGSQYPHRHQITPGLFHDRSRAAAKNYCRNPDNERGGPWCYTIDRGTRWEYCDIPRCPDSLCEEGWLSHGRSCYLFIIDTDRSWNSAKTHCESLGSHLLSIQSEAEFRFVTANIKGVLYQSGKELGERELWWTSGRKLNSGQFNWQDRVRDSHFWSQWYAGQPDNTNGNENSICLLRTSSSDWGFNDLHESAELRSICEYEMVDGVQVNYTAELEPTPIVTQLSTPAAPNLSCPYNWHPFRGKCYWFHTSPFKNWFDANGECWRGGGSLTTIETQTELDFITSYLGGDLNDYHGQWWIGAFRGPSDQWYWIGDSNVTSAEDLVGGDFQQVSFTAWHDNEPNNWADVEDSATMLFMDDEWLWNDDDPRNLRAYICESNPNTAQAGCDRQPCSNGATCVTEDPGNGEVVAGITDEGPYCICPVGFAGILCEINENAPWETFGEHSYLFVYDHGSTRPAAQRYCEIHGANLVSINSQEEQRFLESRMRAIAVQSPLITNWWTGAEQTETHGQWQWADGTPMTYTNWAPGEPNAWRNEKSVELTKKGEQWKWNDYHSTAGLHFICELPIVFSDE